MENTKRVWRNLADAPVSETGLWGFDSLRPHLASVAQRTQSTGLRPRAQRFESSRGLSRNTATPWPSGEARACKARYGGSIPPGVFQQATMEGVEMSAIKTFGTVDERSLAQLKRCMDAGDAEFGVLCADHHPGYSQPIGGAIAYEGYVSPSGAGYVLGCGNKAARTELTRADLDALGGVESIMRDITRRISFGMGVPAQERSDHPVLDKIRAADFAPQRKLHQVAASQLGTVGSGNHYVNLMEDEEGRVWVGASISPSLARPPKGSPCARERW